LDNTLAKYEDIIEDGKSAVPQEPAMANLTVAKKSSLMRLKRTVTINWLKVRWDCEGRVLTEYRDKLQRHTDAINIVLNTFLW
jgi:hypothetical protein